MSLIENIEAALADKHILPSTAENLKTWVQSGALPHWAVASITELVEAGAWAELNNRFYKYMAFGTGGMRGRTIGERPTAEERGELDSGGAPARAGVGTAMLNDFNVLRATVGLYRYTAKHLEKVGSFEVPKLVIAHDVRHFSRAFCELAASVWSRLGGKAYIFDGPRSTPHLSFTVRHIGATTGVVITASHNPPHDNGYKVYFSDGAQVVDPHATGIISEVNNVGLAEISDFHEVDLSNVTTLPAAVDDAYMAALDDNVLSAETFAKAKPRVVFTPIHGTGAVASVPLLKRYGVEVETVPEQDVMDGRFPTVKSPNPENADALEMAITKANACGADAVIATDPDADRMGVAVRGPDGGMHLLTGNMIGSILAEFRTAKLKELGLLPERGSARAALIKTFVTTPLQAAIAEGHGLKLIETLTGFKWIGAKLGQYERTLKDAVLETTGIAMDYDATPADARRKLHLDHSTFYVFGGEESYGYLASDKVRDKDANAAVIMFCEWLAELKASGTSAIDYLDKLYLRYGYHLERLINIYYEGASGAQKIKNIIESYRADPPKALGRFTVTNMDDFAVDEVRDNDDNVIPQENFYRLDLDNGYSFAVRGSGTEPKIKFYLFAREDVSEPAALDEIKAATAETLDALATAIEEDARKRAG